MYDAIIVGARCAGSPLAMLLARRGRRVLLVDRATFPSDTLSTHVVQPTGVAALARWGLLDRLVASGCPPLHTYVFDFGPIIVSGAPGFADAPVGYCPRRTVLDALLVGAAREAGAEVREAFTVEHVLIEDGLVVGIGGHGKDGATVTERARVVVGADGRHSRIAAAVSAEAYHQRPPLLCGYYGYWEGLPMEGRFETYIRHFRGFAAAPTHDGLTLVIAGWPYAEFEANKADLDGNFLRTIALAPEFAARLARARRVGRLQGAPVPNFFRKAYGPGWALVGDAGYLKDPITAQGIADAFVDAERCADALDRWLAGGDYTSLMAGYQAERDARAMPLYEMTCQLATLAPPPAEMQALLGAIARDRGAMGDFVKVNAGTISPAEFFAPANVGRIMAGPHAA